MKILKVSLVLFCLLSFALGMKNHSEPEKGHERNVTSHQNQKATKNLQQHKYWAASAGDIA